jgi:hypothetical protein
MGLYVKYVSNLPLLLPMTSTLSPFHDQVSEIYVMVTIEI